ncbi:bifunctional diguanylate cyclase/phosphodiesterase [Phenylobacterium aquaticum]|uniref:putative bifunctional diguanylate cyclase/phosphodiesterase n=1 Tax=Phenylobacterium aquaticum TaxID=1763816 RepID=UPI0026EEE345|nr:EAL domain-containing protein [Phenylobacterium aquaticum]
MRDFASGDPRLSWQDITGWSEGLDARLGEVRAAQIHAITGAIPLMVLANLLIVAVLMAVVWPHAPAREVLTWGAAMAGGLLLALDAWRRVRGRPAPRRLSARATRRATVHAGALGVLWGLAPLLWFSQIGGLDQALISALVVGLMAAGAFALAAAPTVAIGYVAGLGLGAMLALVTTGEVIGAAAGLLLAVYMAVLIAGVAGAARQFVARFRAEAALAEHGQLIGMLLHDFEDKGADWLWQIDAQGLLSHVSHRMADLLGRVAGDLVGAPLLELFRVEGVRPLSHAMERRQPFRDQLTPVEIAGELRWWSLSASPALDEDGDFIGYRGVGSDVTEQQRAKAQIEQLARFDGLTGLLNRTQFHQEVRRAIGAESLVRPGSAALLCLDLDHFKDVNDTLGHPAGDALLCAVAMRLRAVLRTDDLLARLGGDEFAVLARGEQDFEALGARLIAAISPPYEIDGVEVSVGVSIGVAVVGEDGLDVDHLIRNADLALYRAKEDGKARSRRYNPSMHALAEERRALQTDLRQALEADEFYLAYQPILDAATHQVVAFETLLRWRHPTRGEVSPYKFVPAAEEAGLINMIGEWVLRRACMEAVGWPEHVRVAINVSPAQVMNPNLTGLVLSALATAGLAPDRLELEVTEALFLKETEATQAALHKLRALGVRIALDDFGTGYSSLGYLRTFPFDKIKIDKSFVEGATHRPDCIAIIRAIIALADSLGMVTTAEGVETQAQLDAIQAMGCRQVQGFLLSHPVPLAEATRFALLGVDVAQAA